MKIFLTVLALTFFVIGFAQQRMSQPKNTTDVLMNPASNKGKHSITTEGYQKEPQYIRVNPEAEEATAVLLNSNKIITLKEMLALDAKTIKSTKIVSDTTSKTKIKRIILVETN